MADDNRISVTISAADITAILNEILAIRTKLPFLKSLTNQERQEMAKMGDKSLGFDEKCAGYMTSNPAFLPGFIDSAEVLKDRSLRAQIMQFYPQLHLLLEALSDTLLIVNSEIWMADLAYYQSVREAKRRGRPGAETIYNDLRPRFPGSTPGNPTPVPPPPPPTGP